MVKSPSPRRGVPCHFTLRHSYHPAQEGWRTHLRLMSLPRLQSLPTERALLALVIKFAWLHMPGLSIQDLLSYNRLMKSFCFTSYFDVYIPDYRFGSFMLSTRSHLQNYALISARDKD